MVLDSLGEELRVLYVAMTRAKERLIMTGTDRYLEKTMEKYAGTPLAEGQIPYTVLAAAGSYLDWLLMSTAGGGVRVRVTQVPVADIVGEELVRQIRKRSQKERLLSLGDAGGDAEYRAQLARRLSAAYPYEADIHLHTEISVSELKKQGQHVDAAESVRQSGPLDFNWEAQLAAKGTPPTDFSGPEAIFGDVAPDGGAGASRGTAYHRALELLPFDRMGSARDVQEYLEGLVEKRQYTRENLDLIDCGEIWKFLDSGLGRRMRQAQKEGRLHKEQQFVMGLPAAELYGENGRYSDELVIIQGIIDAYLEEADGLVLVDYKTDRIRSPQTLLAHYGVQLEYYKKALEMMTGQKVKEKLIYSLTLQQEIRCR